MAPELAGLDAAGHAALIAALMEEDPFCPAPPPESESWTEARLRAFFQAGGVDAGCGSGKDSCVAASSKLLTREQVRAQRSAHSFVHPSSLVANARLPAPAFRRAHTGACAVPATWAGRVRALVSRPGQVWRAQPLIDSTHSSLTSSLRDPECSGARRGVRPPACGCSASRTLATRRMCTPTRAWVPAACPPCWSGAVRIRWRCWRRSCRAARGARRSRTWRMPR